MLKKWFYMKKISMRANGVRVSHVWDKDYTSGLETIKFLIKTKFQIWNGLEHQHRDLARQNKCKKKVL